MVVASMQSVSNEQAVVINSLLVYAILSILLQVCDADIVPEAARLILSFLKEEKSLRKREGLLSEFFFGIFDAQRDFCIEVCRDR